MRPLLGKLLLAAALSAPLAAFQPALAGGPALKSPAVKPPALQSSFQQLGLKSAAALVLDQESGQVLYGKNAEAVVPIASISKLMTAMVALDAELDPSEPIEVTADDVDWLRGSSSRLPLGAVLTREQLLKLALMASENRAASALSRAYPGGRPAFVVSMNEKARSLGLEGTRFADPTGLSSANVSTAQDLATLVGAAHAYPQIREYSTLRGLELQVGKRTLAFHNTNRLVASESWDIGLSKTGFINEAGRCLVMQAQFAGRAVIIVLLDSWSRYARFADATRVRQWVEAAAGITPVNLRQTPHRTATKTRRVLSASRAGRSV